MKHRNPFMVLFLSIITFGIYDLYWLVKTKSVLNKQTKIKTPTVWLLFMPVIFFIVIFIIALTMGLHSAPQSTGSAINNSSGSATNSAGFTLIILLFDLVAFVVIIPVTFFWFFKFSKAINEYTSGELNTGVTFLLLWMLHFIGVIIVQDKFNDMMDAGTISTDGSVAHSPQGQPAFAAGPPGAVPTFSAGMPNQTEPQASSPAPVQTEPKPLAPIQPQAPDNPEVPVSAHEDSDQSPSQEHGSNGDTSVSSSSEHSDDESNAADSHE